MKIYWKRIAAAAVALLLMMPAPVRASNVAATMPERVNEEAVCVMDAETGIVMVEALSNEKRYPASITKLMTVLLLMEYVEANGGDWSERVTFSMNAVFGIEPGSSSIAMDFDETLSLEQCMYAILLASANEVCMAVAEHIAGTVESFAAMMTARAKALGCTGTNFVNPHGLPDEQHYTTAYDISLIMRENAKFDKFREVIATTWYEIPPTEKKTEPKQFPNSNKLILPGEYYYENCLGGKTGYTDDARHTLVTLHEKDGDTLIVAVMKSERIDINGLSSGLAEYGFSRYANVEVLSKTGYAASVDVTQDYKGTAVVIGALPVTPDKAFSMRLPLVAGVAAADMSSEVELVPDVPVSIEAPVRRDEIIGTLSLRYAGEEIGKVNLVAGDVADTLDEQALAVLSVAAETAPAFNNGDGTAANMVGDIADALTSDVDDTSLSFLKILRVVGLVILGLFGLIVLLSIISFFTSRRGRYKMRANGYAAHDREMRRQSNQRPGSAREAGRPRRTRPREEELLKPRRPLPPIRPADDDDEQY